MGGVTIDLGTALANLQAAFGSLQRMIGAISFVIGIALVYRGIAMYRGLANQTYGSAQRGEVAGPMVFLVVGAVLIYLPTALDTSISTLFAGTTRENLLPAESLIGYKSVSNVEHWEEISKVLVQYMKLIGLIAFIRGWVILSKMGHQGAQPGSIGKGITHIVAGVMLMNIVGSYNIIAQTFGFTTSG